MAFTRRRSERKPAGQLNLAPGAGGGQDLACVIGEITRRIFEDGIPVTPKGKRTLCVARNAKIRMVEEVISFHSNRNLPSFRDPKVFVQRCIKLRKRRPPQNISSGIAKLTGRRYRKSTRIKPAGHSAHCGPIRTDTRVRVANQVRTFRNNQRLQIGIVEVEHRGKGEAAMNAGNARDLPATQETPSSRQIVNDIRHEIVPNVKIRRASASLAIENVLRYGRIIHRFHVEIHRGIIHGMGQRIRHLPEKIMSIAFRNGDLKGIVEGLPVSQIRYQRRCQVRIVAMPNAGSKGFSSASRVR